MVGDILGVVIWLYIYAHVDFLLLDKPGRITTLFT